PDRSATSVQPRVLSLASSRPRPPLPAPDACPRSASRRSNRHSMDSRPWRAPRSPPERRAGGGSAEIRAAAPRLKPPRNRRGGRRRRSLVPSGGRRREGSNHTSPFAYHVSQQHQRMAHRPAPQAPTALKPAEIHRERLRPHPLPGVGDAASTLLSVALSGPFSAP